MTASPNALYQIDAHQDDANAVAFVDDSSHIIVSGGDDGICKVSVFSCPTYILVAIAYIIIIYLHAVYLYTCIPYLS